MHWLMFGMSTVKFGWSWLTISTAGKALKETESEHERHKKVAEEFMKNLAGCEDNLKLLRKQKTSLVSIFNWCSFCKMFIVRAD